MGVDHEGRGGRLRHSFAIKIDRGLPAERRFHLALIAGRTYAAALQRGDSRDALLLDLEACLELCERLVGKVIIHRSSPWLYRAIAREAVRIARSCVAEENWKQVWRILDMVHNFGLLTDTVGGWDDEVFLRAFAEPYLKDSPQAYTNSLRPLIGRLRA